MIAVVLVVVLLLGAVGVAYARRVSTGRGRFVVDVDPAVLRGDRSIDDVRRDRLPGRFADGRPPLPGELRRTDVGPPPGLLERRQRDVGPAGRHRRDSPVVDDPLTMTGFMQQLDADTVAAHARMQAAIDAETGTLPRIPTGDQHR